MTSSFIQPISSDDDNTTTYDYQYDINITTEEIFINDTVFEKSWINDSCEPDGYTLDKQPNYTDVPYITKFLWLLIVIVFAIMISIVVIFRHFQRLQKQKKGKECLQSDKLYAHPFEEVVVNVDEPQSIELLEVRPPTPTN